MDAAAGAGAIDGTTGSSCSTRRATSSSAATRFSSAAASIDAMAIAAMVPRERCRGFGSGCGVHPCSSASGSESSIGSNGVDSGTAIGARRHRRHADPGEANEPGERDDDAEGTAARDEEGGAERRGHQPADRP